MQPVVQVVRPRYPILPRTAALGAFLLLVAAGALNVTLVDAEDLAGAWCQLAVLRGSRSSSLGAPSVQRRAPCRQAAPARASNT